MCSKTKFDLTQFEDKAPSTICTVSVYMSETLFMYVIERLKKDIHIREINDLFVSVVFM